MPKFIKPRNRVGVCFFMESNLGGAATQAADLVTVAQRAGYEAALLRFTLSARSPHVLKDATRLPKYELLIGRSGLRFSGEKLLLPPSPATLKLLKSFDILIFVGGCPHVTRNSPLEDFERYYKFLYDGTLPARKIIFLTDPFWQKLYPYLSDVIGKMDRVYAFAEAYRKIVQDSGLCSTVGICNFGSVAATDVALKGFNFKRKSRIIWPHQWRSWKNPELMVAIAPLLKLPIDAYADGIEYYKIRRDRWEAYQKAVAYDHIMEDCPNKRGRITVYGTVPQAKIIEEFGRCMWMIDFTGMSARTGKPIPKFIGNYQCVNIETMMLGCVNFKFPNTIQPHSQIPPECVHQLPETTDTQEVADSINDQAEADNYMEVAETAREWALANFNPSTVFEKSFLY